jgi:hypothetical protein
MSSRSRRTRSWRSPHSSSAGIRDGVGEGDRRNVRRDCDKAAGSRAAPDAIPRQPAAGLQDNSIRPVPATRTLTPRGAGWGNSETPCPTRTPRPDCARRRRCRQGPGRTGRRRNELGGLTNVVIARRHRPSSARRLIAVGTAHRPVETAVVSPRKPVGANDGSNANYTRCHRARSEEDAPRTAPVAAGHGSIERAVGRLDNGPDGRDARPQGAVSRMATLPCGLILNTFAAHSVIVVP